MEKTLYEQVVARACELDNDGVLRFSNCLIKALCEHVEKLENKMKAVEQRLYEHDMTLDGYEVTLDKRI